MVTTVVGRIKRAIARRTRRGSIGLQGHIEGVANHELYGWAFDPSQSGLLRLGLFTSRGLVATTNNGRDRADVREAGFGDGRAGFGFILDEEVLAAIAATGGKVELRLLGGKEPLLAKFRFSADMLARYGLKPQRTQPPAPIDDPLLEKCRSRLFVELDMLASALKEFPNGSDRPLATPASEHKLHENLFAPLFPLSDALLMDAPEAPPALPGYLDFTRYRYRVDREFDTDTLPEERAHFLNWYLHGYGAVRQGRRIPLSRSEIVYLNAPIVMGGQRQSLTRAMWWSLSQQAARLAQFQADPGAWHTEACYWWAQEGAPALGVEDCLVPDFVADTLRLVAEDQREIAWPLSAFLHRFYRDSPGFHFLDGSFERDRQLLIFSLMLKALRRPDLLRYIPNRALEAAFVEPEDGGRAPFAEFVHDLLPELGDFTFDADRYTQFLRHKGFDFDIRSFLTIDSAGNRYHSAGLAPVQSTPVVDVQMIGPFEKASGLGQATRLSASAMERTGIDFNKVDFGLDNPAPEGFSTATEHGAYQRARVNLIHLNAESIPNAFAYEPDVFNGAYNIGYFFWELDSPAACHYLSFGLLDEIWVSSQYGVDIYQPHTDIPVTRVGMCFEDLDQPSREASRTFVRQQFRLKDDPFIFLVAFDSFSFVQRKNPIGVLKAFAKAFAGVPDVRLILKTQNRDRVGDPVQQNIWRQVEALMERDPRILLMNKTLSYEDLIKLKKGCDAYISLHRSEGWGFGMIEAMNLKVPVICTGYSGNMEFCSDETAWLVDYQMEELAPDDYIFVRKGQKWAEPDIADAARQMRAVYDQPEARRRKAEAAHAFVQENFSDRAIGQRYGARLREILNNLEERADEQR